MPDPDELLASPLASAFFLLAGQERLPAGLVCRPAVADALLAGAALRLNPWTPYAAAARAEVLARAPEARQLAAEVLADPRSAWWWTPVGGRQLAVGGPADPPQVPTVASSPWAEYGQRPYPRLLTSSPYDAGEQALSGMHSALAAGTGDLDPDYPLWQQELTVTPDARVLEVRSAEDWRELALAFPVRKAADHANPDPDGLECDLAPDWTAVARDWDGVHVGFGGLLAAALRPLGPVGERTVLWSWECEQTVWVREAFSARAPLPPLTTRPPLPYELCTLDLATRAGTAAPAAPARVEGQHRAAARRRWFRR